VGGSYSELAGYLRAGGTLILSGFQIAGQTCRFSDTPFTSRGMCATLDQGSSAWRGSYFVRDFMGLDGAEASDVASRTQGAKDFIEARVTTAGAALGFVNAQVDVGNSSAKWDSMAFNPTLVPDTRDTRLAPGLPKIEGWRMAQQFGCFDQNVFIRKETGAEVSVPIMTYHGVPRGVLYDGGASPREGLAVALATQAHDLGNSGGGGDPQHPAPITSADKGVIGRTVILGFPIYYIKDSQAYDVMRAAFAYVNASPTLPSYSP
jgi:hypothetical protein